MIGGILPPAIIPVRGAVHCLGFVKGYFAVAERVGDPRHQPMPVHRVNPRVVRQKQPPGLGRVAIPQCDGSSGITDSFSIYASFFYLFEKFSEHVNTAGSLEQPADFPKQTYVQLAR
jgi:hypothetical protein